KRKIDRSNPRARLVLFPPSPKECPSHDLLLGCPRSWCHPTNALPASNTFTNPSLSLPPGSLAPLPPQALHWRRDLPQAAFRSRPPQLLPCVIQGQLEVVAPSICLRKCLLALVVRLLASKDSCRTASPHDSTRLIRRWRPASSTWRDVVWT
uniref:Uncharacterized protein n=1 Tax=Triticum urartu TaxID=4572 RepID=A0A8R7JZI2_TRIUA